MGISGDQLQQVLGSSSIGNVASQLGMSHGQASSALAQILPELINQLTPSGQLPDNHADLLSQGLAMLTGRGASAGWLADLRPACWLCSARLRLGWPCLTRTPTPIWRVCWP